MRLMSCWVRAARLPKVMEAAPRTPGRGELQAGLGMAARRIRTTTARVWQGGGVGRRLVAGAVVDVRARNGRGRAPACKRNPPERVRPMMPTGASARSTAGRSGRPGSWSAGRQDVSQAEKRQGGAAPEKDVLDAGLDGARSRPRSGNEGVQAVEESSSAR